MVTPAVPQPLPLRYTSQNNEKCSVCRIGLSNKQRAVVAHQNPMNPEGPYIHPIHEKCLLQGYRANRLANCHLCRAPLAMRSLVRAAHAREQQLEIVVRPEGTDRVNEYARSLFCMVIPPALELGWALNEQLSISQQGNQVNAPSLVEESWVPNSGTVAFWLLMSAYFTVVQHQLQRDIEMGRVNRALNLNRDVITATTAVFVGLRSPCRIILSGTPVILPLLGQFVPSENVRNVSRMAWNTIKNGIDRFGAELASGAAAGLAVRMILPREDSSQESVLISSSIVLGMAGMALQEAYKRTNR